MTDELINEAVQAAIDAGLAVNGEYGVAAARFAATHILTASRAQSVTDEHLIRLSDQDRQYLRMIVPGIEQRSREPGDAWNEAAALLWLLIDTTDPVEAAQLPARPVATPDDDIHELYLDALAEAEKAMRKYPQPNYVISKVAEEAGEVVKAAIHCAEGRETHAALVGEIRQAMAMLIRLYIEGDQVHGLASPLAALQQKGGQSDG